MPQPEREARWRTRNTEIAGRRHRASSRSAVVIWSVTALRQVRLRREHAALARRVPDVGGLAEDDPVTVNGVKKGAVKEIRLGRAAGASSTSCSSKDVAHDGNRVYVRNVGHDGREVHRHRPARRRGTPLDAARDTIEGVYEMRHPRGGQPDGRRAGLARAT